MKTSEALIRAKALIDTPAKWTKGDYAKTAAGMPINEKAADAVCFCTMGALYRVIPDNLSSAANLRNALTALHETTGKSVTVWNDDPLRTHDEVMQAFDKAIALAKEQE